ncbi:hypothetical protein N826_23015 [Skermanella aerolata KACC 11604]|nr:hypothetical protein N826_23015 [Skermanella aerolata KACC 11604]
MSTYTWPADGHVLITMGSWWEEAAHFIKDAAEESARRPGTGDFP